MPKKPLKLFQTELGPSTARYSPKPQAQRRRPSTDSRQGRAGRLCRLAGRQTTPWHTDAAHRTGLRRRCPSDRAAAGARRSGSRSPVGRAPRPRRLLGSSCLLGTHRGEPSPAGSSGRPGTGAARPIEVGRTSRLGTPAGRQTPPGRRGRLCTGVVSLTPARRSRLADTHTAWACLVGSSSRRRTGLAQLRPTHRKSLLDRAGARTTSPRSSVRLGRQCRVRCRLGSTGL